ncbi:MAG: hypothetical protein ACJ719_03070 [Nitrososphaeraceae archaeon]
MKPNEVDSSTIKNTKMEPFIFELGPRANKVEILHKDNSIEIKPKGWLGKKNWREINEILLRNGFEWLSSGRDSCWIKMKTRN